MVAEMYLLQRGLTHSRSPSGSKPAPTWTYSWLQSLQECTGSVVGLSMATCFEVLRRDLMHSQWCFKMYLLQHGLIHSHRCCKKYLLQRGFICRPQSLQRNTCCSTDITTATDASRCTMLWHGLVHGHRHFGVSCSCVDSSTGDSPFDLSSHWASSPSSTAAAMPWPSASPGTSPFLLSKCSQAQQSKMISSTASKKQPLTSTRL